MKKNFYFALLEEELVWLKRAVSEDFFESERTCRHRHKILVSRLFRDFMTPIERRDLYAISAGILALFSSLAEIGVLASDEKSLVLRSVELFIPIPLDERVISLQEEFNRMWESSSRKLSCLRSGFEELFRCIVIAALNSV